MRNVTARIFCLVILLLSLAVISYGQNTKGDRPADSRESRFRKSEGRQKVRKKKFRKVNPARKGEFKPQKAAKGGERAGAPVTPLRNDVPGRAERVRFGTSKRVAVRSSSDRKRKLYSQTGPLVSNPSRAPSGDDRKPVSNKRIRSRMESRLARSRPDNVFPQEGRFVNNPSKVPRAHPRAEPNRAQLARLKRLQGPEKKPGRKTRVVTRSASRSYTARRSINIVASYPRPRRKSEQAVTRDLAGRKVRTKNYESPRPGIVTKHGGGRRFSASGKTRARAADAQRFGRYRNFSSAPGQPTGRKKRLAPRSVSATARKFHPQSGPYVNNPSKKPRTVERASSDSRIDRRLRSLQSQPRGTRRVGTIVPRSGSGSFIARRSTNTWAQFPRPKRKGERAYTRDIAGKKLRTRNYETPPREVITSGYKPYLGRKRPGDRAYKGPVGGYRTATRATGRAWKGDIAGRRIRGIKTPREDRASAVSGIRYRSATGKRKSNIPVPVKQPGLGAAGMRAYQGDLRRVRRGFADQGEEYTGNIKSKRRAKGGGSRSGEHWNNAGQPLYPKFPKETGPGTYQGTLKARRPLKGGGSVSGKLWNNQGRAIAVRTPRDSRPGTFQGTLKAQRPIKGGGSISGKLWNNQGRPLGVRIPEDSRPGTYQGTLKARRPLKGGGSVSGKLWNNQGRPLVVRTPEDSRPGTFQGTFKARRPVKGGGSISGRLWNNREQAIPARIPPRRAAEVAGFPGKMRRFEGQPGFSDQGEEYTGNLKARKPLKGGGSVSGKLWNNQGSPLAVRRPEAGAGRAGTYSGNVKLSRFRRQYVRNPNAADAALAKRRPSKSVFDEGELQAKTTRRPFVKNPNSSADALRKQKPTKGVYQEGELQVRTRQYHYVRNTSSSSDAMKVREPGRAFGRSADFQGNIRMQKFAFFQRNRELHPDAKFVKTNRNNVPQEKDALTNLKLWWARLFRKGETQPDHLKEKIRRPRYDKGEQGLWYE